MVGEIAKKWTQILRTGAFGVRFMGVDRSTIMFNMEEGQDTFEVFRLFQIHISYASALSTLLLHKQVSGYLVYQRAQEIEYAHI